MRLRLNSIDSACPLPRYGVCSGGSKCRACLQERKETNRYEPDDHPIDDPVADGDWRSAERDMVRARFEPVSYRSRRHMNRQYD